MMIFSSMHGLVTVSVKDLDVIMVLMIMIRKMETMIGLQLAGVPLLFLFKMMHSFCIPCSIWTYIYRCLVIHIGDRCLND